MRFRAKVVDIGCVHHLTRVVNTISKLLKKCTLRFTSEKVYFILPDQVSNGGVSMWCEIKQENFFDEYQMEGVNKDCNEIYLEVVAENLSRALKSAQAAKALKIKLTKKQSPCLSLEVELPSLASDSRTVTHDIPVTVIPRRLWGDYAEPNMPNYHVTIFMPPLKMVKTIAEKMKNISSYLILAANQQGEMLMRVDTDLVTVKTSFQDLDIPDVRMEDEEVQSVSHRLAWPPDEFASARIDIKKFLQFLAGQIINPERVICNIVDGTIVQFFLLHDELSLQYFIPAIAR
ncbi:checkpoint protein HUS1-like [Styela clava]